MKSALRSLQPCDSEPVTSVVTSVPPNPTAGVLPSDPAVCQAPTSPSPWRPGRARSSSGVPSPPPTPAPCRRAAPWETAHQSLRQRSTDAPLGTPPNAQPSQGGAPMAKNAAPPPGLLEHPPAPSPLPLSSPLTTSAPRSPLLSQPCHGLCSGARGLRCTSSPPAWEHLKAEACPPGCPRRTQDGLRPERGRSPGTFANQSDASVVIFKCVWWWWGGHSFLGTKVPRFTSHLHPKALYWGR